MHDVRRQRREPLSPDQSFAVQAYIHRSLASFDVNPPPQRRTARLVCKRGKKPEPSVSDTLRASVTAGRPCPLAGQAVVRSDVPPHVSRIPGKGVSLHERILCLVPGMDCPVRPWTPCWREGRFFFGLVEAERPRIWRGGPEPEPAACWFQDSGRFVGHLLRRRGVLASSARSPLWFSGRFGSGRSPLSPDSLNLSVPLLARQGVLLSLITPLSGGREAGGHGSGRPGR